MPIKDLQKRREYQRQLMAKKRQGLTENNVRPCSRCRTEITNWYHLIIAEQEKNKLLTRQIHRLTKEINRLEKQIKSYETKQTH